MTVFYRRAVAAAARLLSRLLLTPAFFLLFLPRRLWLAMSRRDPLDRAFPGGPSAWHRRPAEPADPGRDREPFA